MEIILLERINRLGNLGDKIKVKPGYARNYLLPQSKAIIASKDNMVIFEKQRHELEKASTDKQNQANARAEALDLISLISIAANASDEGKLYGSVGTKEIVETLKQQGFESNKSEISMPNGVFREVGEYDIDINLGWDIIKTVHVVVVAQ